MVDMFLTLWWPIILPTAPANAIFFGRSIRWNKTGKRLAIFGVMIFVLLIAPVSFTWPVLNHVAVGIGYAALCFALASVLTRAIRNALLLTVAVLGVGVGFVAAFAINWQLPERTVDAGCGLHARLTNSSSLSADFTTITLLRRVPPLQLRVASERLVMAQPTIDVTEKRADGLCELQFQDQVGRTWRWSRSRKSAA